MIFSSGASAEGYQKAPPPVRKILDLPPTPTAELTPDGKALLLAEWQPYPSIGELARPYLRLAGLRVDPKSLGQRLPRKYIRMTIRPLDGGKPVLIDQPEGFEPGLPEWSPDGKRFALPIVVDGVTRLFRGFRESGRVLTFATRLNSSLTNPIQWMPDSRTILCLEGNNLEEAAIQKVTIAPVIQESAGKAAPTRTFQDLLRNADDERMFARVTASQIKLVDSDTGKWRLVGREASVASISPSPDGKLLLVSTIQRPYSYLHPVTAFPRRVEVWDLAGKVVHRVADLPLADKVPIEGVRTGPRLIHWRPDAPATLVWAEALDGGDPRKKAPHRDVLWTLAAPFKGDPRGLMKTTHRLLGIQWGEKRLAVVTEYEREKRRRRTYRLDPDGEVKPELLWDLSVQDRYNDPGTPMTRVLPSGKVVIRQDGDDIFLGGQGASAKGARPFLDRYSLKTKKAKRLYQSAADVYEPVVAMLDDAGKRLLTRHESPTSPPNYRVREGDTVRAVTNFKDTAPELRKLRRRLEVFKRPDGVILSFNLYLPPGYKPGTRLPTVVWAYPREYTDATVAGQAVGTGNRYTTIGGPSHLFFLLAGYAVIESSMPVIGTAEKANDTFVEQIVANAKAAIDRAVALGVTDRDRVGVGGHSYGAFMTANLLAHSDLFRAGIARSGAYNRTLTPFGFQSERRTLWQAPEVYLKMSPFMHAHKIKEPILLIHGADDNNAGTFPMQSERLYQAIRGNGGTARYVSLPHESHGYAARESVEHVLHEMIAWFDKHVKNAPPRGKAE